MLRLLPPVAALGRRMSLVDPYILSCLPSSAASRLSGFTFGSATSADSARVRRSARARWTRSERLRKVPCWMSPYHSGTVCPAVAQRTLLLFLRQGRESDPGLLVEGGLVLGAFLLGLRGECLLVFFGE